MSEQPNEHLDKTPRAMFSKADLDADLNIASDPQAEALGKQTLAKMSADLDVPAGTQWYIIEHGPKANREDEPAKIIGHTNFDRDEDEVSFCAVVKYADGEPRWVPMSLPQYAMGKAPPHWYNRDRRNPDTGKWERKVDRERWLEFVPESCIRKAYKLKG